MAKQTKQQEIEELKSDLQNKCNELAEANSRKADLAEEKQKLEEQLAYVKAQLDQAYEDHLLGQLHWKECHNAAEFYLRQSQRLLREIVYRGSKREKHDLEYAVVRALVRSNNELSAENLRKMAERTPGVDLRKLIFVAAEFSSKEDEAKEKENAAKPVEVKVWWTKDGWKR